MKKQLEEIGEIIKKWNVNLDSATSIELAKKIKPLFYWYHIKDFVLRIFDEVLCRGSWLLVAYGAWVIINRILDAVIK